MTRAVPLLLLVAITAALAGCGGSSAATVAATDRSGTAAATSTQPRAPATGMRPVSAAVSKRLAANRLHAGEVVDGDIQATLASLKGIPVVVMQWASWCPQCAKEFPWFQQLAVTYRSRVAFVGLNARDARGDAEQFSAAHALRFASVFDADGGQSASIGAGRSWPTTVLYDASGNRTVRPGAFGSFAELDDYIHRYALRS